MSPRKHDSRVVNTHGMLSLPRSFISKAFNPGGGLDLTFSGGWVGDRPRSAAPGHWGWTQRAHS